MTAPHECPRSVVPYCAYLSDACPILCLPLGCLSHSAYLWCLSHSTCVFRWLFDERGDAILVIMITCQQRLVTYDMSDGVECFLRLAYRHVLHKLGISAFVQSIWHCLMILVDVLLACPASFASSGKCPHGKVRQ